MGGAAVGGGGALLPDSASSPSSDPLVDLNVVDYVLKKPFSDESFRLLLEAAEADHLQVHAAERRHRGAIVLRASLSYERLTLFLFFFAFFAQRPPKKRNYDKLVGR